jgi:Kef-type K+ transport system membrane component KefB
MWGLHIMDLQTREDAHNPLLIGFAIVSVVTTFLALALLPMTIRRRRKKEGAAPAPR